MRTSILTIVRPLSVKGAALATYTIVVSLIQDIITMLAMFSQGLKKIESSSSTGSSKTAVLAIGTSHFGCVTETVEESLAGIERAFRGKKSDDFVDFWKRTMESSGTKSRTVAAMHGDWAEEGLKAKKGLYAGAKDYFQPTPQERNAIWRKYVPMMAVDAARTAIKKWKGDKQSITHIVFHSCTGFKAPGVEVDLIDGLSLKNVKRRTGINYMGCFGGLNGMAVAKAFCDSDPTAVCLLVCVEVCSIHLTMNEDRSYMLGNSIFADGASAAIIGQGQPGDWLIAGNDMLILGKETRDTMTWAPSNAEYEMFLDRNLGQHFGMALWPKMTRMVRGLTGCNNNKDVQFCVHPGGKGILIALEKIGVSRDQLRHSWETLANYGNMSSATILFVLNAAMKDPTMTKDNIFAMAFGPGLTIESCGLRKISDDSMSPDGCPVSISL